MKMVTEAKLAEFVRRAWNMGYALSSVNTPAPKDFVEKREKLVNKILAEASECK